MFFTREDREKHEALAPVAQFAAQLGQKYGLHGREKELADDIQAFLDSHVVFGEVVEGPFPQPVESSATTATEGEN